MAAGAVPGPQGLRCSMLWPDPTQRGGLVEIRDNLIARILEAKCEGWFGEVEGLQISLIGTNEKLAQIDERLQRRTVAFELGIPAFNGNPSRLAATQVNEQEGDHR